VAQATHVAADLAQRRYARLLVHEPPILIITVCTPEDIELAIHYGVDGVVVSNHGGRQLDGIPATLDALRDCAPVARGRIPIAIDGGIRRGSDIFKALALGADYCFIGRIPIWGLAVGLALFIGAIG
jgi:(S)-2-hydroxy-acid oxidase